MPAVCLSETVYEISEPVEDTALQGVKEIVPYVTMYWTGERPSDDLAEDIEKQAEEKLKGAGFETCSNEPNEAMIKVLEQRIAGQYNHLRWRSINLPELMIRIYVIKHQDSGTCVFNVQTSLARKVYTAQPPRKAMKAEVWRIDVGPSATNAENFKAAVSETVLSQVKAFIAAYQKANSSIKELVSESREKQDAVVPITAKREARKSATEAEGYYVASKNSRVFHNPNCYAAKRIMPKNLVKYSSRERALQDGKRPCKICKP
jgi:hypothetical protein